MTSKIQPVSPIPTSGAFSTLGIAPVEAVEPDAARNQGNDLRLIIEEDEATGIIVYKTLDRRTGEIVRQLPREEVIRLKDQSSYAPGDVADSLS